MAKVECTCLQCGSSFYVYPYRIARGEGLYCSLSCSQSSKKTQIERDCEYCGTKFLVNPSRTVRGEGRYCSKKCFGAASRSRCECTCNYCGVKFITTASHAKQGVKYCTKKCSDLAKTKQVERKCETCEVLFMVSLSKVKKGAGKYCSIKCSRVGQKKSKINCSCFHCGKKFYRSPSGIGHGKQYCSRECRTKAGRVNATCLYCGKIFSVTLTNKNNGGGQHCSRICRRLAHNAEYNCKVCGKKFTDYKSTNRLYCSQQCHNIDKLTRVEFTCLYCGKIFTAKPSQIQQHGQRKYCSKSCYGLAKRGANHPNWMGGIWAYGQNWYQQRKLAYERDGGICQICHRKPKKGERRFQVHHINKARNFGRKYHEANDLSNLITLCPRCHVHAEWGKIAVPKRLL